MDWVDGQITYLEAQETAAVVSFCTRLLQLYSSHNIGKVNFFFQLWCFLYGPIFQHMRNIVTGTFLNVALNGNLAIDMGGTFFMVGAPNVANV